MFKSKKLVDVLKSPIRYKSARNQFKFEVYKTLVGFDFWKTLLNFFWVNCVISIYFLMAIKKFMLVSYSQFFFKKDY